MGGCYTLNFHCTVEQCVICCIRLAFHYIMYNALIVRLPLTGIQLFSTIKLNITTFRPNIKIYLIMERLLRETIILSFGISNVTKPSYVNFLDIDSIPTSVPIFHHYLHSWLIRSHSFPSLPTLIL